MSIRSTDHSSEVQHEFCLQLAYVFFHPVLVYGVLAQIQLLQVRQLSVHEETQTGFGEFVASQHQSLDFFVGYELQQQRQLMVGEAHVDKFYGCQLLKIKEREVAQQIYVFQLIRDQLKSARLQDSFLIGLLHLAGHDSLQCLRLVLSFQSYLDPPTQLILAELVIAHAHFAGNVGAAGLGLFNGLLGVEVEVEFWYVDQLITEFPLYFGVLLCVAFERVVVIVELVALQEARLIQASAKVFKVSEALHALSAAELFLGIVEDAALMWLSELHVLMVVQELTVGIVLLDEVQVVAIPHVEPVVGG